MNRLFSQSIASCRGLAWILFGASFLVGCGRYSFSGSMNPNIRSIAIPVFEDRSAEFGIRDNLTSEIVDKFLNDNNLRVTDPGDADSIIQGVIHRVEDHPVAIQSTERAQSFELNIYVHIIYEDRTTKTVIFDQNLRGRGIFSGPEDREQGIAEAIDKLSTDILNMVISNW